MRKLIYGINVSIDGCCDHAKSNPDENVHKYFAQLNREADTFVYGRKTYELMVPFWPDIAKKPTGDKTMDEFAQSFVSASQIVVFSKSLKISAGDNTKIVRDNLREEVLKLKQQSGKDILTGGVDLPSQLIELGLVDEIHLVVHPIVVGEGRRLFDDLKLANKLEFKLEDTQVFKSGSVVLRYSKQ